MAKDVAGASGARIQLATLEALRGKCHPAGWMLAARPKAPGSSDEKRKCPPLSTPTVIHSSLFLCPLPALQDVQVTQTPGPQGLHRAMEGCRACCLQGSLGNAQRQGTAHHPTRCLAALLRPTGSHSPCPIHQCPARFSQPHPGSSLRLTQHISHCPLDGPPPSCTPALLPSLNQTKRYLSPRHSDLCFFFPSLLYQPPPPAYSSCSTVIDLLA